MVAQSLFWLTLPAVVYGLLASFALRDDSPPRWRSRAARHLRLGRRRRSTTEVSRTVECHGTAAEDHVSAGRHDTPARSVRPRAAPVDPFDALTVQIRLGVVATQLRTIENDPRIWARARRFQAAQHAYDDLLAQACLLAGVEVDADEHRPGRYRTEPERFREEVELAARGWTW